MALTILHGENLLQSRQAFFQHLEKLHEKSVETTRFEAKELEVAVLESVLGTQQFFAPHRAIIIDSLHSLPISAKKKQLIALITSHADQENLELLLWEKKKLTATQLKVFAKTAIIQEFKTSSAVFAWLDAFHLKQAKAVILFRKALASDGVELCLAMFNRQVRLLLTVHSGGEVKGAPFMVQKLRKQAQSFTLDQLIYLHERLTFLDYHWKTGQIKTSLQQEVERIMIE